MHRLEYTLSARWWLILYPIHSLNNQGQIFGPLGDLVCLKIISLNSARISIECVMGDIAMEFFLQLNTEI